MVSLFPCLLLCNRSKFLFYKDWTKWNSIIFHWSVLLYLPFYPKLLFFLYLYLPFCFWRDLLFVLPTFRWSIYNWCSLWWYSFKTRNIFFWDCKLSSTMIHPLTIHPYSQPVSLHLDNTFTLNGDSIVSRLPWKD